MAERICVIVNPAAGRGRGAKMVPEISAAFSGNSDVVVRTTQSRGEESSIATAALDDGSTTIVVVGGDGTTANVANSILVHGGNARLAVMPAGTGNDFAKVLGTDALGIAEIARLANEESQVRVDTGLIEERYFLNCCGFGFDVAVLQAIDRTRWLTGSSVYIYTAMRELFAYRGVPLRIESENANSGDALHLLLVIANSARFGGAFQIAPRASVVDGLLDSVAILDLPPMRRVAVLAAATRGNHGQYPECVMQQAREFTVTFASAPAYETDGEVHHARSRSLRISSCPSALRVVAVPGALH